ncbi:MAG TPA: holo-ACP synthase [Paenalcaligenes hominis]|uniref:Holo-[acyl-carrier-protein] synthase n=1 Tax=Paenalcaligenes hominis TaxID=643674 RepID=A0A9D2VFS5_9BURK|nr:holo-ACP synthase [Paenalcaligenes hominis]NJB63988.1 holo-[acyl-carrier protein] synthase [Paenalcaligenes hominis]GGE62189.1 holo-[acyl-carrier-protein] synthase [Paenalcaligenes hominis]HJH23877.1 holo-ACP synthase [Paenalcaligenes hominis]
MAAIAGIGTDIMYISRIQASYDRFGERFLTRILGEHEKLVFQRRYARDPKRGMRFLATRFAAKEAFSKAIGLGMRMPMAWSRMQTLNAPSGKPMVVLSPELQAWYQTRFGAAHITLTDESDLVMAFAVVESLPSASTTIN